LLPLVWFLVASLLAKLPRLAQSAAVILVTVFQLVGVRNAIAHQSTIKGSYNTDFPAVMRKLNSWKDKCPSLFVFNHDVVLTEMLRETGGAQSSPYLMGAPDREHFPVGACYVVVKTYHEPFDVRAVNAFYNGVQTKSASRVDAADISVDIDFKAKSWIRHESFAPFLVHLDLYRVVRPVVMGRWKFPGWTRSSGGV
jgi:hypothetical protein